MTKLNENDKKIGTTGHSWDGIEELNNPMPRWWLYTFYLCIVWGDWLYNRLPCMALGVGGNKRDA